MSFHHHWSRKSQFPSLWSLSQMRAKTLVLHRKIPFPLLKQNSSSQSDAFCRLLMVIPVMDQQVEGQEWFGANGTFIELIFMGVVVILVGDQISKVEKGFWAMETSINGVLCPMKSGRYGVLRQRIGRAVSEFSRQPTTIELPSTWISAIDSRALPTSPSTTHIGSGRRDVWSAVDGAFFFMLFPMD